MTARILAPCYLEHILDFGQTGHDPVEVLCIVDADGQADDGTVVLHLTVVQAFRMLISMVSLIIQRLFH
jgi:hypothetical protein